jgi:hypothetical protein
MARIKRERDREREREREREIYICSRRLGLIKEWTPDFMDRGGWPTMHMVSEGDGQRKCYSFSTE